MTFTKYNDILEQNIKKGKDKLDILYTYYREANLNEKFDTIIDFGTSEHIFNVVENLSNISKFCKNNGIILHSLPANNNCGHGFWQFSPELFFSLYSENNGFSDTEFLFLIHTINMSGGK